jgi:hypothetical protein
MHTQSGKLFERFSPKRRAVILPLAALELGLKIAALRDINRRPADQVRGSKLLWRLSLLVNTFGPLSYFRWGRRTKIAGLRPIR